MTEAHCNQSKGIIKGMGSLLVGGLCVTVVAAVLEKAGFECQDCFFPDIGFIAGSVFGVWLAARKRAEKKEDEAQGLILASSFGVIVPLFYRIFYPPEF